MDLNIKRLMLKMFLWRDGKAKKLKNLLQKLRNHRN